MRWCGVRSWWAHWAWCSATSAPARSIPSRRCSMPLTRIRSRSERPTCTVSYRLIGSLLWVWLGIATYVLIAAIWLIPNRRMEHYIDVHPGHRPCAGFLGRRAKDPGDNCRRGIMPVRVGWQGVRHASSPWWACSPSALEATDAKRSRGSGARWEGSLLRQRVDIPFRDSSGWAFHGAGLRRSCLGFVASR